MRTSVQWVRRGGIGLTVLVAVAVAGASTVRAACVGDCNGDGEVTVTDLIKMVNVSLETAPVGDCTVGDANGDGSITVNEIISGVNNSLNGCPAGGVCGNGTVESGEDCDNGGICVGGDNAGTACTAETQCQGDGVCVGGAKDYTACASNAECPDGSCVHCRTFGGDGCAANCTTESTATVTLKPGELTEDATDLIPGTTGYVIHGDILTIPLPFPQNTSQIVTVGKEKDGQMPAIIKAGDLRYPAIPVQTLACTCLRGADFRTCGGTLTDIDGRESTDCSPDFTAGATVCTGKKPCAAVYGPGNAAAGVVGCQALDGVDLSVTQDAGGESGVGTPPVLTFSGTGGPGSAVLRNATAQGFVIGPCNGSGPEYGPDGAFCTVDDPTSARGAVVPGVLVTGTASATVTRANGAEDGTIGPFGATGVPLSCSELASGDVTTGTLATAFTQLNVETLDDVVVTGLLVTQ